MKGSHWLAWLKVYIMKFFSPIFILPTHQLNLIREWFFILDFLCSLCKFNYIKISSFGRLTNGLDFYLYILNNLLLLHWMLSLFFNPFFSLLCLAFNQETKVKMGIFDHVVYLCDTTIREPKKRKPLQVTLSILFG